MVIHHIGITLYTTAGFFAGYTSIKIVASLTGLTIGTVLACTLGFMGAKEADFLPLDKTVIEAYDKQWAELLRKKCDENEALQYEAMKPLREYVMNNYTIVRMFGGHVLFKRK